MENKLYTWDEIYERAIDTVCGSPELRAKDEARFQLEEIINRVKGYDINTCECPEEEIDDFLAEGNKEYLFDTHGNFIKTEEKEY